MAMPPMPWSEFFMVAIAYQGRPSHFLTDEDHDIAIFDTEERAKEKMRKLCYDDESYFIVKYGLIATSPLLRNEGGHHWDPNA